MKKQSIYLSERDTGELIGVIKNIPLMNDVEKINWIAISSTDTLCIDNAKLNIEQTEDISKDPYDSIEQATDLGTTHLVNTLGGGYSIDYYKLKSSVNRTMPSI